MSLALQELIKIGEKQMADAGVADAEIDAKQLYCYFAGLDNVGFMMHWQDVLPDNMCEGYFRLVARRAAGEPLQYITGTQDFMGFTFSVNPSVLIPRQDTETLTEDAAELIEKGTLRGERYGAAKIKEVLDLCCGSGAIGISLAKLCAGIKVTGSDVSGEAVSVAAENAKANGCRNIKFEKSDLFDAFKGSLKNKKFDLIISNPPYVRSAVIPTLQREIKEHEPILALDGGADGLEFYRRIVPEAQAYLNRDGVLMMEIGFDQAKDVLGLIGENDRYCDAVCLKDLAGKDRIVTARFKGKESRKEAKAREKQI